MNKSLESLLRWFCKKITFNELSSIVVVIQEILSGKRTDFEFKPEMEARTENYRRFEYDDLPALTEPPQAPEAASSLDWIQLLHEYKQKNGKELRPVHRKSNLNSVPHHCHCELCGAPEPYLYLNDGKKGNQVRCKICNHLSTTNRVRILTKAKYYCPYCGAALFHWKELGTETIYKCPSNHCPHYLERLEKLTSAEKKDRITNPYTPNYKLHYQYREYHIDPQDLACARPSQETKVDLSRIHNSYHTAGLVLSFFINLGLSSRLTKLALKGLFGIDISHQTIINYMNAAAARISSWLDRNMPKPGEESAGDETYIIVDGEWHYTWFVIDTQTRAVCGWNVSDTRGTEPALATLINTFGQPESNPEGKFVFIRDGLGSYDAAAGAYNQLARDKTGRKTPVIETKTVVGLEDKDAVSAQYRSLKQMIERFNRTYKFHTRPRNGFKDFNGAVALTALFVAYYNHLRSNMSLHNTIPIHLEGISDIESWPKQWEKILKLTAA